MGVTLQPGMHVLDLLYPHPDEGGGSPCDHIVLTTYIGGDGCHTGRENGRGGSSTVTGYYVPKLAHLETFCACLAVAVARGVESFPVKGYKHRYKEVGGPGVKALPYFDDDQYHVNYLVGVIKLWRMPEWKEQVIEGLTEVLIRTAPKDEERTEP